MKFAHAVLNSPAHNGKWGRNKMGANTVHTRLRLCFSLSASSLASFRRLASKSSLTHFCLSLKCSLLITVSDWLSSESDLWDLEGFDWSVETAAVFWLVDLDAESGTVVRGTGGFTKGLESFSNCNSKNSVLTCVSFTWLPVWVLFLAMFVVLGKQFTTSWTTFNILAISKN